MSSGLLLSRVWLFVTPRTAASQASQSITNSQSLPKPMSITIQPSHPLSSPSPSAFSLSQNQGLFQWVSTLYQVPKYWTLSFSISPSNEYSGLISFTIRLPGGSEVKASASNEGDLGLIPGSGRSPGEGYGNPLQYSCLENPMDGGAWWATVHRVAQSDMTEWLNFQLFNFPLQLNGLIFMQFRDSQESSPTPQFKSISALALSFIYGPTLASIHDYWKNYSFD